MAATEISIVFVSVLILSFTILSSARSAFFIFGDSSVDTGNNNYIKTFNRANFPPYGQNGFFADPTGRFSDGRVIVDYIAEYAKLPTIPPFFQPSANFTFGANFASAGAGVLSETNFGQVISLQGQVYSFQAVMGWLIRELGDFGAQELISGAVYYISIGSSDYLEGYVGNRMHEAYLPEEYVEMVISNMTRTIQELHELGARKFAFQGLGPLGCLPMFRAVNTKEDGSCVEQVSLLALAHNRGLAPVLVSLEFLLKGFKYANSDVYSWLDGRIQEPSKYGFKDGVNACCGEGPHGGMFSCGKANTNYKVCEVADDHVWWDSFNPSERIQEQLAITLWGDGPPSVGPYNLEGLFFDQEKLTNGDIVDGEQNLLEEFGQL